MRALRELAPDTPVIVIKCGAAGAIAHEKDASDYLESPTAAESAVDETGAGDVFCGGALVGFSHNLDLREALARAGVSASFAVEAVGPSGLVTASREEAEGRFQRVADRIEARPL
jgi:sugar/nucleoside kinase (ribokinase family)